MSELAIRIRTIKQAAEYFRTKDPETCITEWYIRELVRNGKFKCHKAGKRYLINLDSFQEWLNNPPVENDSIPDNEYGRIRKI